MLPLAFIMFLFIGMTAQARVVTGIELTPDNSLLLRGMVDSNTVNKLIYSIIKSEDKQIYLFIDSFGGSVMDGIKLMDTIKNSNKKITCITSTAVSMAFAIFQTCHQRLIVDHAILMQHVASYGIEGREPNNYTLARFLKTMMHDIDLIQAKRIGISLRKFKDLTNKDWWLWNDNAIRANVADGKVNVTCSKELINKTVSESFQVLFFTIEVQFSGCPLIPGPLPVTVPTGYKNNVKFQSALNKILSTYDTRKLINDRLNRKEN